MKKVNGSRLPKYLPAVLGICLIAILAEVILLVYASNKKPKKTSGETTVTPSEAAVSTVEPTKPANAVTPGPEREYEKKTVRKLSSEVTTYLSAQITSKTAYEYDEEGREAKMVFYTNDGVTPQETVLFHYDRSGIVLTEHFIPTEEGELREKKVFYATVYGVDDLTFGMSYRISPKDSYQYAGETVLEMQTDESGNLTYLKTTGESRFAMSGFDTVEWEIDPEGVVRTRTIYDPDGRKQHVVFFRYDDSGRLVKTFFTYNGTEFPIAEYMYDEDSTTVAWWGNGIFTYTYCDGLVTEVTRFMGYDDDWPGIEAVNTPDRIVPTLEKTKSYWVDGYYPVHNNPLDHGELCANETVEYGEDGSVIIWASVDLRPDGQPLCKYDCYGEEYNRSFEYDENGRLTRFSSFYGEKTIQWDEDGNVVLISDAGGETVTRYTWTTVDILIEK